MAALRAILIGLGLSGLWILPVLALDLASVQAAHAVRNDQGICGTFISSRGYDCTEFLVPTNDGFLLAVQRMASRRLLNAPNKEPVFLYHGLMQSGETWVLNEPHESLAFILADAGYEVWIGSTRTSTFSYGHKIYNRGDKEFWNWNWDDLVEQDLPAMLHFVNNMTKKQILYVGFSQGTMSAFAAFTNRDIGNLVKKAAMLSPIAYLGHISSALSRAAAGLFVDQLDLAVGMYEFNISALGDTPLLQTICGNANLDCYDNLLNLTTGPSCCVNQSRAAYYKKYDTQSTSTQNLAQLAQLTRSGRFCKYDYGWIENLWHYGTLMPPSYDLSKIRADLPFFLAYGGNDLLADAEDVKKAAAQLPGDVEVLFIPKYSHLDFVLGTSAHIDVYPRLLQFFSLPNI